jgi:hypothetical protein
MKAHQPRGVSTVEFAFGLMVLVPLVLGTGAIGINLIHTLQTIQLARDAGHMYARGVDFSQSGNVAILVNLGQSVGLQASGGNAVVILTALTYVDANTCQAGTGSQSCANLNKWVFVQRQVIGNSNIRTSNFGSPLTSGPTGVTLDSTGSISMSQYCTQAGAVATFSGVGFNPYKDVNGQVSGLPSGQRVYLAEAAGQGFGMPPFVSGSPTYAYNFF